MKKIGLFFIAASVTFAIGCNNSTEESASNKVVRTEADSLYNEVNDGHNVGMAKMGPMMRAKERATALLDSIAKLPAKAQEAAAPYKAKINSVLNDLSNADSVMDKWMREFEPDSAANDLKKRVEYLKSEKFKVDEVKQAILGSLEKADSVLKKKF